MEILIGFIALCISAAGISIGSAFHSLTPGRILWPSGIWVSSPIQASQCNTDTNIKLTFTFRVSTKLIGGVLQINLPAGISGGPWYIDSDFYSNKDITLVYPNSISVSFGGVYGPFSLMTRSTSTGKIYDVNYIFGYIALKSAPYSQSLTVTNANGNSSPKIGSTDGFYFDFTISKSLWKSDIIEIVPDTNFGISSKVVCESAKWFFMLWYVKISSYSKK